MLSLNTTTQSLEVLLTAASAAPLPVASCYRDLTATDATSEGTYANTNGTTAVTVVAAPPSGERHLIDFVSVYNPNAANSEVTIRVNNGGTFFVLSKVVLAQNERLQYTDAGGWAVYASSGALKTSINQGTNSVTSGWSLATLGADVVNNNAVANSIASVTGLAFPVVAGQRYRFKFVIWYTAAATTTGSRWSITGPSFTSLVYYSDYSLTATTRTLNEAVAYDLPAASNASSASVSGNMAIIEGYIVPSANGDVTARFASEIASSAITAKAGSSVAYIAV